MSMSVRHVFSDVCLRKHLLGEIVYPEYLRPDLLELTLREIVIEKILDPAMVFPEYILIVLFSSCGLRNEIHNILLDNCI